MFFSEEELAANERLKEDAESCGGTGSPYGYGQKFRGWLNKDLLTVTAAVLREAAREGREKETDDLVREFTESLGNDPVND